jgi:hypothetical protein
MRLGLAEVAWGSGDREAVERQLGPAHAEFEALVSPAWAARAEGLAGEAGVTLPAT